MQLCVMLILYNASGGDVEDVTSVLREDGGDSIKVCDLGAIDLTTSSAAGSITGTTRASTPLVTAFAVELEARCRMTSVSLVIPIHDSRAAPTEPLAKLAISQIRPLPVPTVNDLMVHDLGFQPSLLSLTSVLNAIQRSRTDGV